MNQKKEKYQSVFTNETEDWKEIPNCNGNYYISSHGRVVSLRYGLLKTPLLNTGYPHCNACVNGKRIRIMVHRIVGKVFIPNPYKKATINHKNGIKCDNRVSNLEWATQREQNIHSAAVLGRKGAKNYNRRKIIIGYRDGETIISEFMGIREAARQTGMVYQQIQKVLSGEERRAHGWFFECFYDPKWIPKSRTTSKQF